jgi:hypothetical protein
MSSMSSKFQCAKYQGFSHIFVKCTSKPLVIEEQKNISQKEDYCI